VTQVFRQALAGTAVNTPHDGGWPCHLFERESAAQQQRDSLDEEAPTLEYGKAIRCAYCKTIITYQGNAEIIQGRHVHHFTNPGGYEFTLGCYRRAWCNVVGRPMLEWTWFSAHTWQYALCPQCQEHLGWFYHCSSEDSAFFGLILDRLIVDSAGHGEQ